MPTEHSLEFDDKRYLWHPFTQQQDWEAEPQLVITDADGCYLIDQEGKRYLDGVSSLWANLHGHRHPLINAAITQQLDKVAHTTMLGLTHPKAIELGKRLIELAPGRLSRVFYSDTGAAAMEIALKQAFQYWQQSNQPQRTYFLSITNAYHGDTVGAMSIGGMEIYRHAYTSLFFPTITVDSTVPCTCGNQPSCTDCHMPCLDELERVLARHGHELAGVVIEPLFQGAGGIRIYPRGYTRAVWEMTKRHGALFIVDEVATGFGRTGTMFACEHEGIEPDIMGLAKGITGGYLPLAATLATEEIYQAFLGPGRTFYHGHTYTGNPLACAAALANLDIFVQEQTLHRLQPRIEQLTQGLEQLRAFPLVADIRQYGFVAGIELAQQKDLQRPFPAEKKVGSLVIKEARRRGVILRPLSDVLVLMPPLAISEQELALLIQVTGEAIQSVAEKLADE
ncbi:adenosylmethionine--8-amino-7-oxononanoate transaminase [Tengunoibacter tsumagoiensis]|uniref:Adenosylmethionine-8-amino-7-oxononanoate aminotransferase n=1 Tax=Tengunoibacter tsumagoiensis TaxID=2014871 RepID=A0A402A891_9CHLR|nr:adenosylmethionine--8-amino-7-oxononanoate transaminase [Tengunoibacter tsumagoiensis]GCE15216.1 adenosylmethionine-8-amino-7-oxononanoate aminotransferase [Tengunoibacter tsumagoiensis]